MNPYRIQGCLTLLLLMVGAEFPARTTLLASETPGQFAVLIGVEPSRHAPESAGAVNDTLQLSQTLRRYGGYLSADILPLIDVAIDPMQHPTQANLLTELPRWLSKAGRQDRLVISFIGHAFRDDSGEVYLAGSDTNPADLPATGVAVSWLKELLASHPSRSKLLLLETRRSPTGSENVETSGISAAEVAEALGNVPGLTVLAACSQGQSSLMDSTGEQSLFARWTREGLKGHADADHDGSVTVEELSAFVQRHVAAEAEKSWNRPQQTRRLGLLDDDDEAPATVCRLVPQSLKRTLADLADHLTLRMRHEGFARLGVLEFMTLSGGREVLGAEFGVLGRYCGSELQQQLLARAAGQFEVVDQRRLEQSLKQLNFTVASLGSAATLRQLGQSAGELPVVAVGSLADRDGRTITLHCQLLRTDNGGLAVHARLRAELDDSEWAMLGKSVEVIPADYQESPNLTTARLSPDSEAPPLEIPRLDERSARRHPLADPKFPLRVRVMVGNQERPGVSRDGEWLVRLKKGEVYRIQVESRMDQPVFLRLLVDGLNTLPERVRSKGVEIEAAPARAPALQAAWPMNLAEARAWRLEPRPPDQTGRVYGIRGFFSKVGENAQYNEFRVVDAPRSQAARLGFATQTGMITAAFYRPVPKTSLAGARSLGTALGEEYQTQTDLYRGPEIPGPLLAVIHIRYVP